ncbi:MAG TPA: hypothetical protein DCX27_10405 [Balneola sp.]|nr:hypothetical protein [Balneola sp.]
MVKFGLMLVGYKGLKLLESLSVTPEFVVSYDNKEKNTYEEIQKFCDSNGIKFYNRKDDVDKTVEKIFLVGWQFLISGDLEKYIVLHDSYLPERRGFCPTVSALIEGADYIGASAFRPIEGHGPDYGTVFGRCKKAITHPIKIKKAFDFIADMYVSLIEKILVEGETPIHVDFSESSFSVWKNEEDFRIDWSDSAENIHRKICASGYPYDGAISWYDGKKIRIKESSVCTPLNIIDSHKNAGKFWKIEKGIPTVICGSGLIDIITDDVDFKLLRKKFL